MVRLVYGEYTIRNSRTVEVPLNAFIHKAYFAGLGEVCNKIQILGEVVGEVGLGIYHFLRIFATGQFVKHAWEDVTCAYTMHLVCVYGERAVDPISGLARSLYLGLGSTQVSIETHLPGLLVFQY